MNFPISSIQDISKGIYKIKENVQLPAIFDANSDYINIITKNHIYVVNKENNSIKFQKDIQEYTSPFLLYMDKSKNYFLLTENLRYKISLNAENEILNLENNDPLSSMGISYQEYFLKKGSSNEIEIIDSIIYGLNNTSILFYSTSENEIHFFKITFSININDIKLTCKITVENYYICIFISNTNFYIGLFNCDNDECVIKFEDNEIMSEYIDVLLYDTLEANLKIFCSKSEGSNYILLQKLIIESNANNEYTISPKDLTLSTQYDSNSCNIKYCKFIEFLTEYLFCCSCTDYIKCTRFTLDFIEVNHFILNIEGENSFLSIINNVNYFSILFLNGNSLYKKNIYQTYCGDTNKDIYQVIEININRLVGLKIDSNYFLMFDGFEPEILMIKYNEEIIQINQTINLIYESDSDEVNFKFILKNGNILDNSVLNIFYTISNEPNYFSTCSINLNIKSDDSTKISTNIYDNQQIENSIAINNISQVYINSKDIAVCFENCLECGDVVELENGNIINQNCLSCKDGYYFLFQTNNCYNSSIMEQGYYFSSFDSMYHKCDIDCKICIEDDSINQQKCISCNNGAYLFPLNNSCLNSYPINYKINKDQNECIPENLEQKISLSELKEQISKNFSSFLNSTNVINGTDFIAMIYSVDDIDPREQIKQGISAIDLGNCTNIIKEYYNISKEESFIVLNLESKKNQTEDTNNDDFFDLGKNNLLELYDFSGNKLNLSVCHENIKIMKYQIKSIKNLKFFDKNYKFKKN